MRPLTLTTLALALALFTTTFNCAAATFSSTRPAGSRVGENNSQVSLRFISRATALSQTVRGDLGHRPSLFAGSGPVTLTVDTTTDKATVNDIDFFVPAYVVPEVLGDTFDVNVQVQVAPPNFPNPPVYLVVQGTYEERITVTGTSAVAPTFVSGSSASINYNFGAGHFEAAPAVSLVVPDITVFGTYEAIGPSSSISQPFSIVFRARANSRSAQVAIPGGPGLGNGFDFTPYKLEVDYRPVNNVIFNGTVDNVTFSAFAADLSVNYFVPEPGSLSMIGAVLAAAISMRRLR